MFNKRGQELSTGTIILLIIGVIILVLLALGFTSGWSKLFPFLTKTNVEQIRTSCSAVCTEGSQEAYCLTPRDLYSETGNKLKGVTCYYLGSEDTTYGVQGCGIDCSEKANIAVDETALSSLKLLCNINNIGVSQQSLVKEDAKGTSKRLISYLCPTVPCDDKNAGVIINGITCP